MSDGLTEDGIRSLESEITQHSAALDEGLTRFVQAQLSDTNLRNLTLKAIAQSGFKVRSFLARATCDYVDQPYEDVASLGMAIELFMAAAFVIDDYFDKSNMRSGEPAIWQVSGTEDAIIVSEVLHCLANKLLHAASQSGGLDPCTWARAADLLNDAYLRMYAAEFRNVNEPKPLPPAQAFSLAFERTGNLVALSVTAAAMFRTASSELLERLASYGKAIGNAFQLRDDIADLIAETECVGKPVMGDVAHGRQNYVLSIAYHESTAELARLTDSCWRSPHLAQDTKALFLQSLLQGGAIEQASRALANSVCQAKNALRVPSLKLRDRLLSSFATALSLLPVEPCVDRNCESPNLRNTYA